LVSSDEEEEYDVGKEEELEALRLTHVPRSSRPLNWQMYRLGQSLLTRQLSEELPMATNEASASTSFQLGAWRVPLMLAALTLDTASNDKMNDLITRFIFDVV